MRWSISTNNGARRMMNDRSNSAPAESPGDEPGPRVFALRWADGREEIATGSTLTAALLSLGYGFDDFKDLTWEEQL
jgi:hypothetical protein